jgi:hypothetical protein
LRLRSAQPSESQRSRNRFRYRNVQRQPTQNTVGKKQAGWEDVDSDYRFGNFRAALYLSFKGQGEPDSFSISAEKGVLRGVAIYQYGSGSGNASPHGHLSLAFSVVNHLIGS